MNSTFFAHGFCCNSQRSEPNFPASMKSLVLMAIGMLAFSFGACQRHSASELQLIKMPGENIGASDQKNQTNTAKPADDSKPAANYF